jgi:tRNA (guanosine-2'-O-)-methyltransferase
VLGAEKWGLGELTASLMDEGVFIPMRGMVQSLNVSVAAATLLFEALRQRQVAGIAPQTGEGLEPALYQQRLFEWSYPEVAAWCQKEGRKYPALNEQGEIQGELPRNVRLRC